MHGQLPSTEKRRYYVYTSYYRGFSAEVFHRSLTSRDPMVVCPASLRPKPRGLHYTLQCTRYSMYEVVLGDRTDPCPWGFESKDLSLHCHVMQVDPGRWQRSSGRPAYSYLIASRHSTTGARGPDCTLKRWVGPPSTGSSVFLAAKQAIIRTRRHLLLDYHSN